MAKRRSSKKPTRRRRSVGKINATDMITTVVALGAGAAGGMLLNKMVLEKSPNTNPKIVGGAMALLGVLAAGRSKSQAIKMVGMGLSAAGGLVLAQQFKMISGVGRGPVVRFQTQRPGVAGYSDVKAVGFPDGGYSVPALNGFSNVHAIAGAGLM